MLSNQPQEEAPIVQFHGTITVITKDGSSAECSYIVDTDKGELVQLGGEGEIDADTIDLIVEMCNMTASGLMPDIDIRTMSPELLQGLDLDLLTDDEKRREGLWGRAEQELIAAEDLKREQE